MVNVQLTLLKKLLTKVEYVTTQSDSIVTFGLHKLIIAICFPKSVAGEMEEPTAAQQFIFGTNKNALLSLEKVG